MIKRVENLNQMMLKHGLEGLSEEYQAYWQMVEAGNISSNENVRNQPHEQNIFKAVSFVGYSVICFGLLYLLAVLMHYMAEG